jgi:hypothetical protein
VKEIELTRSLVALVDDADFERVSAHRWYARSSAPNKPTYAARGVPPYGSTPKLLMHRWIIGAPAHVQVDHCNGNGLDNRRENLRLCTPSQNAINRRRRFTGKSSRFVGVHLQRGRWCARIVAGDDRLHLGTFRDEAEAARAYDRAALLHHGEFAVTNFPREDY